MPSLARAFASSVAAIRSTARRTCDIASSKPTPAAAAASSVLDGTHPVNVQSPPTGPSCTMTTLARRRRASRAATRPPAPPPITTRSYERVMPTAILPEPDHDPCRSAPHRSFRARGGTLAPVSHRRRHSRSSSPTASTMSVDGWPLIGTGGEPHAVESALAVDDRVGAELAGVLPGKAKPSTLPEEPCIHRQRPK